MVIQKDINVTSVVTPTATVAAAPAVGVNPRTSVITGIVEAVSAACSDTSARKRKIKNNQFCVWSDSIVLRAIGA